MTMFLILYISISFIWCFNVLLRLSVNDSYKKPGGIIQEMALHLKFREWNEFFIGILLFLVMCVLSMFWPCVIPVDLFIRFRQKERSLICLTEKTLEQFGFTRQSETNPQIYELITGQGIIMLEKEEKRWKLTVSSGIMTTVCTKYLFCLYELIRIAANNRLDIQTLVLKKRK